MASMTATIPMRIKVVVRPHGALWRLRVVTPLLWLAKVISRCEFVLDGKVER